MSLIQVYLDKANNSNDKLIDLLKKHNVNFLQFNIKNSKKNLERHELETVPALKFKDLIINDINEESIKLIVNEFNNFVNELPINNIIPNEILSNLEETKETKKIEDNKTPTNRTTNQILMGTIRIKNRENLIRHIKNLANKHKT